MVSLAGRLEGLSWVATDFELTPTEFRFSDGAVPLRDVQEVVCLSDRELRVRCAGRDFLIRCRTADECEKWHQGFLENGHRLGLEFGPKRTSLAPAPGVPDHLQHAGGVTNYTSVLPAPGESGRWNATQDHQGEALDVSANNYSASNFPTASAPNNSGVDYFISAAASTTSSPTRPNDNIVDLSNLLTSSATATGLHQPKYYTTGSAASAGEPAPPDSSPVSAKTGALPERELLQRFLRTNNIFADHLVHALQYVRLQISTIENSNDHLARLQQQMDLNANGNMSQFFGISDTSRGMTMNRVSVSVLLRYLIRFLSERNEEERRRESTIMEQKYESDNWRWYIFAAERRIDATKIPKISIPPAAQKDVQRFTSFLPRLILEAIGKGKIVNNVIDFAPGKPMPNPVVGSTESVLVFVDASGFTAMTEKLTNLNRGTEQVGTFLNSFFRRLIDIVLRWDGDIIKFSGDAVTIMFPVDPEDDMETRKTAPLRAACCCQEIHQKLSHYPTPVSGVYFSFHIGVGYGPCTLLQLGGVLGRFEYCATGPAFPQIAIAEPLARATQTCASPEFLAVYEQALHAFSGREETPTLPVKDGPPGYRIMGKIADPEQYLPQSVYKPSPDFDVTMLSRYIPMSEFRAILADERFEEEMRKISVIFLSISSEERAGADVARSAEGVLLTQLLMSCCQRSCYALEGSVNKFVVDDKGMLLLCCFGLKPLSHFGDDPVRATLAAMRMLDTLREEGVKGRAGVATGMVWCGVIGTAQRREYTVLGDVVNLAARLMGNASEEWGILACPETARCLQNNNIEVLALDPIKMKGKAAPVPVFRPTGRLLRDWLSKRESALFHPDANGTEAEREVGDKKVLVGATILNPEEPRGTRAAAASFPPNKSSTGTTSSAGATPTSTGKSQNLQDFWLRSSEYVQLETAVTDQLSQGGGVTVVTGDPGTGKHEILEPLRKLAQRRTRDRTQNLHSENFLLLEGNALNPTQSHMVQFLPWQTIFNQLGEAIRADLVLIEEIKARTGLKCDNMCEIMTGLLADEELCVWLPLLSKVMCSVEFGDTVVKAQTDCDLRHTGRNRLMQVCLGVLDAYSRRRRIVVLLHLQRSAAFFEDQDKRTGEFSVGLTNFILKERRKARQMMNTRTQHQAFVSAASNKKDHANNMHNQMKNIHWQQHPWAQQQGQLLSSSQMKTFGGGGPAQDAGSLVFVLCTRPLQQSSWFDYVKEKAECINGLVHMQYFSRETATEYFRHCLTRWLHEDCAGLELPEDVKDYLMDMSVGNAFLINLLAEHFVRKRLVAVLPTTRGIGEQPGRTISSGAAGGGRDDLSYSSADVASQKNSSPSGAPSNAGAPSSLTLSSNLHARRSLLKHQARRSGLMAPGNNRDNHNFPFSDDAPPASPAAQRSTSKDVAQVVAFTASIDEIDSLEVDGVLGIAFTHFDRLSFSEQKVLKLCAALNLDNWTSSDIAAAEMSAIGEENWEAVELKITKAETLLQRLAQRGILSAEQLPLSIMGNTGVRDAERGPTATSKTGERREGRSSSAQDEEKPLKPDEQREFEAGERKASGPASSDEKRPEPNTLRGSSGSSIVPSSAAEREKLGLEQETPLLRVYSFAAKFYRLAAEKQVLESQRIFTQNTHRDVVERHQDGSSVPQKRTTSTRNTNSDVPSVPLFLPGSSLSKATASSPSLSKSVPGLASPSQTKSSI